MHEGQWDQARSVEAFLADLHAHRGIEAAYLPRYRELTEAFLRTRAGRPLDALDADDLAVFLARCRDAGHTIKQLRAAETAAVAFMRFAARGGLIAAAPPEPPEASAPPSSIPDDLRRVLSLDALAFALGITAPIALGLLSNGFLLIGWVLYYAALAGTFFQILDHFAHGRPGLPMGAAEGLARSLGRGLLILFVGVLPPVLAWMHLEPASALDGGRALGVLLAAVLGAGLMPAAALAVYASDSALAALAPHLWWRVISRIPQPYLRLCALFGGAIVARTVYLALVGAVLGSFPILASLVFAPPAALLIFALAAALGGVVWRERDELGI